MDLAGAGALGQFQLARRGEQRVADLLRLQTLRLETPEQGVLGIPEVAGLRGRVTGGLPVGRAGQDQPVHRLLIPALRHELGGEPIQQLGVRGRFAQAAEVAAIGRQAASEVLLPEAIHREAGREGVGGFRQPTRQRGSSAGGPSVGRRDDLRRRRRDRRAQHGKEGRGDERAFLRDGRVEAGRARFRHRQHQGRRAGLQRIRLGEFPSQVGLRHAVLPFDGIHQLVELVIDLPPGQGGDLGLER